MPTSTQWIERNTKAINVLLEKATPEAKAWVHNFLTESGSALEDPFCSQIATNAYLAYIIRDKPDEIRNTLEIAEANMLKKLGTEFNSKRDSYEQALSAELEARIGRMAERLICGEFDSPDKPLEDRVTPTTKFPIHPVAIAGLGVFAGLILGLSPSFLLFSKEPSSPSPGNNTDAHILKWAKSKQGKFARQLIEWNGDRLLKRRCESEARNNNITLSIQGIQATKGVCAIFVRDPRDTKPEQI